ncbi:MAG: hypothetical protein ABSE96_24235, partial [Terracidiphilus sp.]
AEQTPNRDRRPKTVVITHLYATPDPRFPTGSESTNVGAGCNCHPTGIHNDRATRVPSHPVWPKAICTLSVTNLLEERICDLA